MAFSHRTIRSYKHKEASVEKFAVISDIHSNVFALKAVVEHAKSQGIDTFINLGDILYGPIAPRLTYDYLRQIKTLTISGNQDRQIYEATTVDIESNPTMAFILDDLGDEPLEWMKQLPSELHIYNEIYACHGTPDNDLVYLLENINSGTPEVRTDSAILKLLNGISTPIILCGHTHTPRCIELSTGQLVINPGSVGLQAYTDNEPILHSMQNYSSKASYATLFKSAHGVWEISFHKVSYSLSEAISAAEKQGREDWIHFLATGRCL